MAVFHIFQQEANRSSSSKKIGMRKNERQERMHDRAKVVESLRRISRWGCPSGKFSLKFDTQETCYLLKGRVKAYIKDSSEVLEFGAGDLLIIPQGLSCTWDVSIALDKHYKFDS
ncbi:uncharacterized protein [Aristolochia californica]|uniref:uncharacterized protein n=1 Tax=Aristolochia californica TaxID=171875 RepID=UPI0035DA4E8F